MAKRADNKGENRPDKRANKRKIIKMRQWCIERAIEVYATKKSKDNLKSAQESIIKMAKEFQRSIFEGLPLY